MSFSYGSNSRRHKSSGRHFKLFSDELPQIDFDKASMEKYSARMNENRRTKGRRRTFRDSNHDRFSLPSLGTPEWDKLSESDKGRPTSYSPFNPLNPNFSKIHQKIHRRHTLKETKVNDWGRRNHGQGHIVKTDYNDSPVDKNQYINAWQEIANQSQNQVDEKLNVGQSTDQIEEEPKASVDRTDGIKRLVEKPPTPKKKSVFKELLDAASKENDRINQIKESLNFNEGQLRRHYSLRALPQSHAKIVADHQINVTNVAKNTAHDKSYDNDAENVVPEVISEPGQSKPGILKHGARVRESHTLNTRTKPPIIPVKPRLVHHDDLPHFGPEKTPVQNEDEVKVSVHTAAPMNRVEDLVFVPLPSNKGIGKQKRVNFNEKIDIKEKTAVSDLLEANEDSDNESGKISKQNNTNSIETVHAKDEDAAEHACPRVASTQIRRRANVRHKEHQKPKEYVSITRRHPSIANTNGPKSTIVPRVTKHSTISKDYIDSIISSKNKIKRSNDLKLDPAWKEAKPESHSGGTALVHEPVQVNNTIEVQTTPVKDLDKDSKRTVYSSPDGRSDSRSISSIPVLHIPEIHEFLRNGNSSSLNRSPPRSPLRSPPRSPPRSPLRSPPKTPDIDFESLSEFTALFSDEFDLDITDEIDRSMLGEDLIKAYRFWDRKKKAFPGGLRKIEAPVDRSDGFYPKEYGNVKTYKINNPRLDRPPLLPSNNKKSTVNGGLMDWV